MAVALAMASPLGAQRRSTLEVGVSGVEFTADSTRVFGPFASWLFSQDALRYFLSGSAAGVASPSGASGSVDLAAGRRVPLSGGWLAEASAELSAVVDPASRPATSVLAAARLLRPVGSGGGWLRASGDLASREAGRLDGQGIDLGAWWRWPRVQVTSSLSQQWNLAQLFLGPSRQFVVGTVPVRYTEATLALQLMGDESRLDVSAGVRRDRDAPRLYTPAVSATAALWQSPTRAVVVTLARHLPDFIRGADAVDYVSVGMRFNEPSPRVERAERARPILRVSGSDSVRTLLVHAPDARSVEIQGDFTGWEAIRLVPQHGVFSVTVTMAPGSHRVAVRLDGGRWATPANTPAVDDDFGGRVGLLLVP